MANILNIKPHELATRINRMEKQERYQQLKGFYIKEFPKTKEFYDYYKNRKQEPNEEFELKSETKFTSSSIVDEIDNEMNELLNEFKNEQKSHTVLDKAVNDTEDILIEVASKGSIDYDSYLDDLFQ